MTATLAPSESTRNPAERATDSEPASRRSVKPRRTGLTQIHGRFYNAAAQRRLANELELLPRERYDVFALARARAMWAAILGIGVAGRMRQFSEAVPVLA